MNSNQEYITSSTNTLRLPQPDPDNITVLAHNLPSKPILPWNRFDSLNLNKESKKLEQTSQQKSSATGSFIAAYLLSSIHQIDMISLKKLLLFMMDRFTNQPIELEITDSLTNKKIKVQAKCITPIEEKEQNQASRTAN